MDVKLKKLYPDTKIPTYTTDGSGCFDFYSLHDSKIMSDGVTYIRTGISVEIPKGHVMLIFSRSGHGFKNDIRLSNCVGVIDSDYRGEIQVKLKRDVIPNDDTSYFIEQYDRVAQGMIIPVQQVNFIEVDELSETDRGAGGFGHTGK